MNVTVGEKEDRMMITGMHTVVDIFCVGCGSIVGWKYVSSYFHSKSHITIYSKLTPVELNVSMSDML